MSVVGVDIISKRGKRRKCLPLEIRAKMYEDVIELKRQGLKPSQIQEELFEKYKVQLCMKNIYNWINGKHYPFGNVNNFNEKPSPKLAYIVGVIFTDGYKYIGKQSQYSLRLAVNDREFAEKFAECLTEILKKKKPYKPFYNKNQKKWIVAGCSVLLFGFLNRTLKELKPIIEHDEKCVSAFLQALFDGEGTIYIKIKGKKRRRGLYLFNTNKKLLIYAKYLLRKYFSIEATGPYLKTRKGTLREFPNGVYKATKDCHYIYIRTKSLSNFYRHVGFSIKRKQQKLIKAIK
jgi:intein-encoded DNA endonuclease-like protein